MWSFERWGASFFASDQEATNFTAHVGWSLAFGLAGHMVYGALGVYIAFIIWILYALFNEFFMHGKEGKRELYQDLFSRIVPITLLVLVVFFTGMK